MNLQRAFVLGALILVGLAATVVAEEYNASPADEPAVAMNCAVYDCGWTVTADALFLQRSPSGSQRLLTDPIPDTELFNASAMKFSTAVGPRLSLRRQGVVDGELELVFFGIDGFGATADFPNSALPSGLADLAIDSSINIPVDSVDFRYRSQIYNVEFNYRKPFTERLTVLCGFRFVELDDRYEATGTESVYSGPFTSAIRGRNHLYGLQLGGDLQLLKLENRFQIDGLARAGVYGNFAGLNNDYLDTVRTYSANASTTHVAFLGEIGLTASYRLTDRLVARAGYQLLWIDGVALGPSQIATTDFVTASATVNTAGTAFYHGATAGLELTW